MTLVNLDFLVSPKVKGWLVKMRQEDYINSDVVVLHATISVEKDRSINHTAVSPILFVKSKSVSLDDHARVINIAVGDDCKDYG